MMLVTFVAFALIATTLGQDTKQACLDMQQCVEAANCPESNSVEGAESNSGEGKGDHMAMKQCVDSQLTPEELAPGTDSDCHPGKIMKACENADVDLRSKSNSKSHEGRNGGKGKGKGKHGSFPNALKGCMSVFHEGMPEDADRKCKHDAHMNCMQKFGQQIVPGCSLGDRPACSDRVANIIRGCKAQNN